MELADNTANTWVQEYAFKMWSIFRHCCCITVEVLPMTSMKAVLVVLQIIGAIGGLQASSSLQSQPPKSHEKGDEIGLPPTGLSRDLFSSPIVNSANKGVTSWRSSIESMQIIGSATNDTCRGQVANIGDFNNDGHADFAVGCHLTNKYNRINNGQVFVFFSRGERLELTKLSNFAAGI